MSERRSARDLMGRPSRRGLGLGLAGAWTALAAAPSRAEPAGQDLVAFVHPELRKVAQAMLRVPPRGGPAETLAADRKALATGGRRPLDTVVWSEQILPGLPGEPDVRVYVINAGVREAPRAAILHTHGGGFVGGSARSEVRRLQDLAVALDCVIVTVEYRLAPETPFPGALHDNYAALRWLHAKAAELGVDPARIAVMGESAGGGHAAMLAIAARDRGEIKLAFQALIYPMLDDRTGSTRKTPPWQGAFIWTPEANRFGWTSFLGARPGGRSAPAGAVPARVKDLSGLAPAFIGVGSIDLFVEEDVEYARRLIHAGVATELVVVPGAFHGFDLFTGTTIAQAFKSDLLAALRAALSARAA